MNRKIYKWFYNRIHSNYYNLLIKWSFFPLGGEKKCRDELISGIILGEEENILDMCCGTGGSTCAIIRRAGDKSKVVGMDLSAGQLNAAARHPELHNVQLIIGDAAKTGFKDCYFDKVFITHALHEMPRQERLDVLGEARRILKENGTVIVLELHEPENRILRIFFGFWFFYWLPFNFESSTRKDMLQHGLSNEIIEAGFRNVIKTSKNKGVLQTVQGTK